MKPNKFKILIQTTVVVLLTLLTILFPYCRKDPTNNNAVNVDHPFLQLLTDLPSQIPFLEDSIRKNINSAKLDTIVNRFGLPIWDKAFTASTHSKLTSIVPIARNGEDQISSFIVFEIANKFKWRLFDIQKPERYGYNNGKNTANARSIFIMSEFLNYRAFDDPTATIGDPCMMTNTERARITSTITTNGNVRSSGAKIISLRFISMTSCYAWTSCTGDGNGNCIDNLVYHMDCSNSLVWIPDDYNEGNLGWEETFNPGTPNDSQNPHGHDPYQEDCNSNNPESQAPMVLPPDKPIYNVSEYIGCFDKKSAGKVTFYADQPVEGSTEAFGLKEKVGHSYVTIEQNVAGTVYRRTVGFHPSQGVSPFFNKSTESQLGDDSNVEYDVKLETTVTPEQMGKILTLIENHNPVYNIESYNCTHFALDISVAAGLNIPRTVGWWIVGSGLNPANFGEDLKKMTGSITQKGHSENNTGNCN
ncbi:hypothetical protein [Chitinophaga niabensis]|uniref:Uncharacterized protein n=1 Tax=Chitinophaga niabensis TaxID=536979 RepID=A0A1N6KBS5_9BACT|nr:hypothetical protein [Chitinophaga niabensis]SIO53776.1 hypothetical protein SAMN04488055_5477 [Chitinophaga niabensis]